MFHFLRRSHRVIGVGACVFFFLLGATGLLLAMKSKVDWLRPATKSGTKIDSPAEVVSLERVVAAAIGAGLAQIKSIDDIERIDYRPGKNVFKVVSSDTLWEVQVDGAKGEVVNVAFRTDQFIESIHDLSFLHDNVRAYFLPAVGAALMIMSGTGLAIYMVPVIRRARFKRKSSL